ncbi:uncharacterized protein N7484_007338 [Penicillium longicatenatum]|uniref:uncharacterized protein n=1 Tax=Penicillium longicatenatum TaxID=1561947 RepID=UPI0025466D41|nr:uncharacterized protein N7484_007338 [Penicillium longicatenatum]KAJ5639476.1 hypothetical protein N7484_007338 [Penicillium longicatenatum]
MRRPRPQHNTTSLPRDLRSELGIRDRYGEKKRRQNGPASRKDRRQAERNEKKSKPHARTWKEYPRQPEKNIEDDEDSDMDPEDDLLGNDGRKPSDNGDDEDSSMDDASMIDLDEDEEDEDVSDIDEPEDVDRPHISSGVKSKLAEDDAEIAFLEKKLGLKKGKTSKKFEDDGLDDLLGDLGEASEDDSKKRKREADEWLQSKRKKAQKLQAQEEDEDDSELESDEDDDDLDEEVFGSEDDEEEDDEFDGFDEEKAPPKKRENPYVAPTPKMESSKPQKYVPPSLRGLSDPETESLTRLKRQAQGQLNKLSEANLISIVSEFEKLYRDYPRKHVTSTVLDLLMGLICERAALQDTFMVLHAGFIAALYKLLGTDVGAEIVERIVKTLDANGDERGTFQGKEIINLVSLLSQLYNFHVIGSPLMFDYIRSFLEEITESNTELLLKVIRISGPQLRQDDPTSLKDIVLLVQPAVAKIGEGNLSVRTKFMIDTITDLKNNRVKNAVGASITSEHITKMRKILGSLNNRTIRASEPINITRADIHNSSKKGKWWLEGASWKEDPLVSAREQLTDMPTKEEKYEEDSDGEIDFNELAKAHGMNTAVRRSIFVAIMTATDYNDASVRLKKLRLNRAQKFEIPPVLLRCLMEVDEEDKPYNPYYTFIARSVIVGQNSGEDEGKRREEQGQRQMKVCFMFALWNIFKRMGERGEMDDEADFDPEDENTAPTSKALFKLAKTYGTLIAEGHLTLSILKNLNFAYLQESTKLFLDMLIATVIQESKKNKNGEKKKKDEKEHEQSLIQIFMQVQKTPHLAKGLIFFIQKVVAKTDLLEKEKQQKLVRLGCEIAVGALKLIRD